MSIRFDICEAYFVLEADYNVGGWLRERASNRRRMESTSTQLHRMSFKASPNLCYNKLTDEGQAIYWEQVQRLNLPIPPECEAEAKKFGLLVTESS